MQHIIATYRPMQTPIVYEIYISQLKTTAFYEINEGKVQLMPLNCTLGTQLISFL